MKTAFVFFRAVEREFDGEYYGKIVNDFTSSGIEVVTVDVLSNTDGHAFLKRIEDYKDTVDNLIVIGADEVFLT